ncbi:hypothetical protein [Pseudolysinimonas sp.]
MGAVVRIAVLVLATAAVGLVLLGVVETLVLGSWAAGVADAARTLFFFADIAFYAWIAFLVIATLRLRQPPGALVTFLAVLAGGILNVLVVLLIGIAQEGRVAAFTLLAVEGSLAVVVAAAVVVPLVGRVSGAPRVKPPTPRQSRT